MIDINGAFEILMVTGRQKLTDVNNEQPTEVICANVWQIIESRGIKNGQIFQTTLLTTVIKPEIKNKTKKKQTSELLGAS